MATAWAGFPPPPLWFYLLLALAPCAVVAAAGFAVGAVGGGRATVRLLAVLTAVLIASYAALVASFARWNDCAACSEWRELAALFGWLLGAMLLALWGFAALGGRTRSAAAGSPGSSLRHRGRAKG